MKQFFLLFLIITAISFSASAQTASKSKVSTLPTNIQGKNSDEILNNKVVKSRLQKILGKKSYADFSESWETVNPIIRKGNFVFSSGCLIHACGHAESAFAIDLINKTIHVGIFREQEKTRFFNEQGRKTPSVIKNWANKLSKR